MDGGVYQVDCTGRPFERQNAKEFSLKETGLQNAKGISLKDTGLQIAKGISLKDCSVAACQVFWCGAILLGVGIGRR
jgi:hypothetical protein